MPRGRVVEPMPAAGLPCTLGGRLTFTGPIGHRVVLKCTAGHWDTVAWAPRASEGPKGAPLWADLGLGVILIAACVVAVLMVRLEFQEREEGEK